MDKGGVALRTTARPLGIEVARSIGATDLRLSGAMVGLFGTDTVRSIVMGHQRWNILTAAASGTERASFTVTTDRRLKSPKDASGIVMASRIARGGLPSRGRMVHWSGGLMASS